MTSVLWQVVYAGDMAGSTLSRHALSFLCMPLDIVTKREGYHFRSCAKRLLHFVVPDMNLLRLFLYIRNFKNQYNKVFSSFILFSLEKTACGHSAGLNINEETEWSTKHLYGLWTTFCFMDHSLWPVTFPSIFKPHHKKYYPQCSLSYFIWNHDKRFLFNLEQFLEYVVAKE